MPDLHPGKGHPIGAAIRADGVVYPHLVGGDIGCGMALFQTSAVVGKSNDDAVRWARANRALLAHRFARSLGVELTPILDLCHNAVTPRDGGWLHRKGAAPHGDGLVVIPGSRGTLTYLVEPAGDPATCGASLAHGAGRKWTRTEARARMRERFRTRELSTTRTGGVVIWDDKHLLFEEAPRSLQAHRARRRRSRRRRGVPTARDLAARRHVQDAAGVVTRLRSA